MGISEIIKLISLLALASVKLFYSAPVVLAAKYSTSQSITILFVGGVLGVLVFYFFGGQITVWTSEKIASFTGKKRVRKKFTWTNRLIVKVKQKSGVIGIALITPVLLSIPIGCIIAYSYYRKNKRTLPALLLSVLLWSFVSVFFWGLFF